MCKKKTKYSRFFYKIMYLFKLSFRNATILYEK